MTTHTQVARSLSVPSVTTLIPQGYLDELLVLREHFNQGYWRVGDITNALYALSLANGWEMNKLEICHGVGVVIGKSGRSVRFYSDVASFYPLDVREMYPEIPFSHFAYAMKFPDVLNDGHIPEGQAGEHITMWKAVLDSSARLFEENGIPPSVERLAVQWEHHENQLRESYHDNTAQPRPIFAKLPDYICPVDEANVIVESLETSPDYPDYLDEIREGEDTTTLRRAQYVRALKNLLVPIPSILEALSHLAVSSTSMVKIAQALAMVRGAIEMVEGGEGTYYQLGEFDPDQVKKEME